MRGLWTHLERLGGGIGTRGPGETQIETDRRLARDRIAALKRRLAARPRPRAARCAHERERAGLPTVALAGYTNAGKSTLLNALTGAERRRARAPLPHARPDHALVRDHDGRSYLLTDTVGFIRKLPHQLVDAFSATLEEALDADLILHVADASAPEEELHEMLAAVDEVLDEIGAGERPRLLVAEQDRPARRASAGASCRSATRDAVQVSARTRRGARRRCASAIEGASWRTLRPMELLVPYERGRPLSELHDVAGDLEREDTPPGVLVKARVPARVGGRASSASRSTADRRGARRE